MSKDEITDEEIARRMERGIRRFLNTPPKPHGKRPTDPAPKPKQRSAAKRRIKTPS